MATCEDARVAKTSNIRENTSPNGDFLYDSDDSVKDKDFVPRNSDQSSETSEVGLFFKFCGLSFLKKNYLYTIRWQKSDMPCGLSVSCL